MVTNRMIDNITKHHSFEDGVFLIKSMYVLKNERILLMIL